MTTDQHIATMAAGMIRSARRRAYRCTARDAAVGAIVGALVWGSGGALALGALVLVVSGAWRVYDFGGFETQVHMAAAADAAIAAQRPR